MTIIQEIHAWSKDHPAWQQDAIARLYANRELSPEDLEDLFALAKAEVGIPDAGGRKPKKLQDAEVAPPANPTRLVQIAAISNIKNVNALVQGGRLPISPTGITAIFGENGAGKSGYSRVFKHACRARDRREPILPNAKLDPNTVGPAQAIFETLVDGNATFFAWEHSVEPPEPLSDISIFDTHCARAYIDNHGDFAYVPYGLDILEGLVGVCSKLRTRATQEKADNAPSDAAYATLAKERTTVAKVLGEIPSKTCREDIEKLAALSPEDESRLTLLTKTLSETEPKQKARTLRQKASRLKSLKERIETGIAVVSNNKLDALRALIEKSASAKKAADLAAEKFKQVPGQLTGTGGDEWKALFEAARQFAAVSHEGHNFPGLPEDALCPLCQNPLGVDGAQRLVRFDAFIKEKVEQAAIDARRVAVMAFDAVKNAKLELLLDDALTQELAELDAALPATCEAMQAGLNARQTEIQQAAGGKLPWDAVSALPADPQPKLTETMDALEAQAKALEASADDKAKAAMVAERLELDARRKLSEVKLAVLEAISKHEYCAKLKKCIDGMDARGISRKSTDLSRTLASKELADALNDELKRLKCHELQVAMKPESPGGRTQFKLTLQLPGGGAPAAILSEGEQRAIAIASFLAEIKLGKGSGGVVFDDPVSSLDHRRRWEVAERLVAESKVRQVIVFTHDIYFLCILEQKAEELGAALTTNYIRRTVDGFGAHSDDLPFDVLGTKGRIGRLRQMLVAVRKAHKDGDEDSHRALTAQAYGDLRLTWERSIEEVLFNGAIQRFGEGVSTQRLKDVAVSDDDYRAIDAGMSKSSKFEHDAAMRVGRLPVPHPDELSEDIEKLDTWRNSILERGKQLRAARS
ncbi:recombination protein F [Caballeronia choica]|uniref:Recombination protein F n=1 Tax=Caballeronia choica TaxID=326476 RepID=A0A158KLR4_9BURK|nr:AAA family ATPase [Caballeronia choica]SAL81673.1 recombination protein F [Caballeronia choica]